MNNWLFGFAFGVAVTAAALSGLRYWAEKVSDDDWGNCPARAQEVAYVTRTKAALWEIQKSGPTIEYTYNKQGEEPETLTFPDGLGYVGVLMGHGYTSAFTQFTNLPRAPEETMPEITGPFTWICISR